jgi:hypothetical protein
MLEDVKQQVESTVTPLLRGILEDTQKLLRQELALAKVEIKEDATRLKGAVIEMGIGSWLAAIASILIAFTLVHGLDAAFEGLPLWGAYAIVALVFAVAAAVLLSAASKRMKSVRVVPERTVETMRENVQWIQRKA